MSKTNKVRTLSFRLAENDYQKLVERCRKAELSKSMYLRYLIRIPIVCDEATGESRHASSWTRGRSVTSRASSPAGATTITKRCMR